ncbi:MAG: hypothetical protein K2M65_02375, partial [Muribaculaceae bacterium]|nr:hypothetical protein [Muribaculaceae bacterium]
MKYNIPIIGKLFAGCAIIMALPACSDDAIDDSSMLEFGISANMFTVGANAGHVDLQLLSNKNCTLAFLEETPWAEISRKNIQGDAKFYIDYDDNFEFPRMTKVIVSAQGTTLTDTITLRQRGTMTPEVTLASGSLILQGSVAGTETETMETNLDFNADVIPEVTYTGGEGTDWIENVTRADDGKLVVKYAANASQNPRSATLNLTFDNGWGEMQSTTLFVTQKNRNDELGRNVSFDDIINLAKMSTDVTIDDYYIITGYVVSNKESRNAGDNIQSTPTSIDYSICDRTVYLESLDGKHGFNILTATADDNVFDRYDRVQLMVKGAVLRGENDPYRYELSGITTSMIVGRSAGSAADIPVKEKYISELTDDDMYTYVTLKDCEFPVRQGPLTPIHDGYTLADNAHRMTKYPRLMRDIQGSSIYLYTNTTCPYRRDGKRLPYGSGKISGVVVFEYFKAYVYGDGYDTDTHGRIGTYQLRHQSYDDIQFHDSETFSQLLTEYRYVKGKAKDTDGMTYWYPTYGNNGRFTQTSPRYAGCYVCTTWNYLGWTGTTKGIAPFRNHVGDDGSGLGIILEDGTDYNANKKIFNTDGKGQGTNTNGNAWNNLYWWEPAQNEGEEDSVNSWLVEFSTAGITTDHLSMQISVQGGRALELVCPIFWKAEWSTERDLTDQSKWHMIAEYQIPDFPIWNNYHEWQLPAFKQIDFPLPLEMLGHEHVYVRMTPTSKAAST